MTNDHVLKNSRLTDIRYKSQPYEQVLQNFELAISLNVCKEIKSMLESVQSNTEFEIRLNYLLNGKMKSGISNLRTKKARDIWYDLIKRLKSETYKNPDTGEETNAYISTQMEKTMSESYGNFRRVTNLSSPPVNERYNTIVQEKKRIKVLDVFNIFIENVNYVCRFVKSFENTVNKTLNGEPDNVRIKNRISFISNDKTHQFDLTYTTDKDGNYPSYEVEIEFLNPLIFSKNLQLFFNPVKLLMNVIKSNSSIVDMNGYNDAIKTFNSFFEDVGPFDTTKIYKRALPQPINLKRNFIEDMSAYAVTNKLNGIRMVGVITKGTFYGIDMVNNVSKLASDLLPVYDGTVFDAEYFNNTLYVFDVLFRSNKDVRDYNFDFRYNILVDTIELMKLENVKAKKFFMGPSLEENIIQSFYIIDSLPEDYNDGIILTPIYLPYFNTKIYKWKPPEMLTIDFFASKIDENQWILQTVDKNPKAGKKVDVNKEYLKTFISPDKKFKGIITTTEHIAGIGEYKWNGNTFVLIRMRHDKSSPNFISVANDVWEDIINPIDRQTLLSYVSGQSYDPLRRYHNSFKRNLIGKYAYKKISVLDLGIGKGGDLQKYETSNIKYLFGVEPNEQFIQELKHRYESSSYKLTLQIIKSRAQQTNVITKALEGKKVDVTSMFFSLSFFFENKNVFDSLIETISQTVIKDGFFIGTTIDGVAVRSALKGQTQIDLGNVTITKHYDDFEGDIKFEKAIDFIYKTSSTVSDKQREWLVDWDMFVQALSDHGFVLLESGYFKPVLWLNSEDNRLSSLYRNFVFKRQSDKGLKKTVKEDIKYPASFTRLDVNKNHVFKSVLSHQLETEGLTYNLFRTGTIANGDCFIHSVMTSTNNADYNSKTYEEKVNYVENYRRFLDVSYEKWASLSNGYIARMGLNQKFKGFDEIFWESLENKQNYEEQKIVNFVDAIGGSRNIDVFKTIMTVRKYEDLGIIQFKDALVTEFASLAESKNNSSYNNETLNYFKMFVLDTSIIAYNEFRKHLRTPHVFLGIEALEIISHDINKNIFIIQDGDGHPYQTDTQHLIESNQSIILLYQGGNHYESVGRLINQDGKNIGQRVFNTNDPLIQLIKAKIE